MAHAPLRVERRDRLGPQILAARRPHGRHRHAGIDLADDGCRHLAALVDLDDERIGLEALVERDAPSSPRPAAGRPAGVASAST